MLAEIPNPWREFLRDIDHMLAQHATAGSIVELHCVGGFVIAMCYRFARQTIDLDAFESSRQALSRP